MTLRIYLAGPMESVGGNLNFPLFDHVTWKLRERNAEVFSPAEHAREQIGPLEVIHALDKKELREWRRKLMVGELAWICLHANAMLLLPGWEQSPGVRAERAVAMAFDHIEIKEAPDVILPWSPVDLFPQLG